MQAAVVAALKLAAPILIVSVAIGLIVSIFQAATQIHEQTLSLCQACGDRTGLSHSWTMDDGNDERFYDVHFRPDCETQLIL